MRQIERIFQKLSEPSKKQTFKKKVAQGFKLSEQDKKNIAIILKRKFKTDVSKTITEETLLRTLLKKLYAAEIRLQELKKERLKEDKVATTKVNRMLKILKDSEVKRTNKTRMGSHFVKLVK